MTVAERVCGCGCGASMAGHRAIARFASRECQVRSLRKNGPRGRAYEDES